MLDQASDLPSRLSACRSTLWPLGPCCSTCTQVTPQPGRAGREGAAFLSSSRSSCSLGLAFYHLVLGPLHCKALPVASWVGLGDNELGYLLRKSLFHPQTEPPFICSGVCRTQTVALGKLRQHVGPEVSAERPPMKLCAWVLLMAALRL